jgi:hypothetical protein
MWRLYLSRKNFLRSNGDDSRLKIVNDLETYLEENILAAHRQQIL